MPSESIEVTQLNNPGGMGHGKWFISRGGSGRHAEYLRKDGTWHKDISRGNFLWDTQDEANAAASPHRQELGLC